MVQGRTGYRFYVGTKEAQESLTIVSAADCAFRTHKEISQSHIGRGVKVVTDLEQMMDCFSGMFLARSQATKGLVPATIADGEAVAAAELCKGIIYTKGLVEEDMGYKLGGDGTVILQEDNGAVVQSTTNLCPKTSNMKQSQHILNFVHSVISEGYVSMVQVPTGQQSVNQLTKKLGAAASSRDLEWAMGRSPTSAAIREMAKRRYKARGDQGLEYVGFSAMAGDIYENAAEEEARVREEKRLVILESSYAEAEADSFSLGVAELNRHQQTTPREGEDNGSYVVADAEQRRLGEEIISRSADKPTWRWWSEVDVRGGSPAWVDRQRAERREVMCQSYVYTAASPVGQLPTGPTAIKSSLSGEGKSASRRRVQWAGAMADELVRGVEDNLQIGSEARWSGERRTEEGMRAELYRRKRQREESASPGEGDQDKRFKGIHEQTRTERDTQNKPHKRGQGCRDKRKEGRQCFV